MRAAKESDHSKLADEFVFRADIARRLIWSGELWPRYWFAEGKETISP